MSGGSLELTSIPIVYNVRHQIPNHKRISVSNLFEECVIRVASWSDTEAPVVARISPGLSVHEMDNWDELYPNQDMVDGKPDIVYRAARGSDGIVRLVTPVLGPAILDGRALDAVRNISQIERMSLSGRFDYPGSAMHGQAQRANPEQLGQIISSERSVAIAYAKTMAGRLVLVDGTLMIACSEPGWICEFNQDKLALVVSSNPTDRGCNEQANFLPYTGDIANGVTRLGYGGRIDEINGHMTIDCKQILGCDPAWEIMHSMAEHVLYDYTQTSHAMTY